MYARGLGGVKKHDSTKVRHQVNTTNQHKFEIRAARHDQKDPNVPENERRVRFAHLQHPNTRRWTGAAQQGRDRKTREIRKFVFGI